MEQRGCIVPVSMIFALVALGVLLSGCASFGTRTDTSTPAQYHKAHSNRAVATHQRVEHTSPPVWKCTPRGSWNDPACPKAAVEVAPAPAIVHLPPTPPAAPDATVKPKKKGWWLRLREKLHLKKKTAE